MYTFTNCAMRFNPKGKNRMNFILKVATSTFQHVIDTSHEVKSKLRQKKSNSIFNPLQSWSSKRTRKNQGKYTTTLEFYFLFKIRRWLLKIWNFLEAYTTSKEGFRVSLILSHYNRSEILHLEILIGHGVSVMMHSCMQI